MKITIVDDPYTEPPPKQKEKVKSWFAKVLFKQLSLEFKANYLLFGITNNDSYGGEC